MTKPPSSPGNPLTRRDLERLKQSWIDPSLAEQALLRRVTSPEGAEIVGRGRDRRNYAGIVFPYYWPGQNHVREYRLRRDKPDLEGQPDGSTKELNKYLSPPQRSSQLYFVPGTPPGWLQDSTLPIIITEGEKKCIALYRLATDERAEPRFLPIAIPGVWNWRGVVQKQAGPNGEREDVRGPIADLAREPLVWERRECLICFDSNVATNSAVRQARTELRNDLLKRGAKVRYMNVPRLPGVNGIDDFLALQGPEKALALIDQAEAIRANDAPKGFKVTEAGVFKVDFTGEGDDTWICSSLHLVASSRDHQSGNWGKLLEWNDPDGHLHTWLMPMALMSGDGSAYREELLSRGLRISSGRNAKDLLHNYIQSAQPEDKVRCVNRVGWQDNSFVLPDQTFGEESGERVIFQSPSGAKHNLIVSGTVEEWRENIARYCLGNNALVFAISVAFAGPLLALTAEGGGGFHYRGRSSQGKTTALLVAGSVWGGGGRNGFVETWRTTANGLEAIAEISNHGLLCLDEIEQCDPREVGEIAYALANGSGKLRMTRSIGARKKLEWELVFLSSGEKSLSDHLQSANKRVRAGQEVRLCDIPSDMGKGLGLFEQLHRLPDQRPDAPPSPHQMARWLTEKSRQFYGSPIRAFLPQLIAKRHDVPALIKRMSDWFFTQHVPSDASSEVGRVAQRFAVIATAGELAAHITGWPKHAAAQASAALFNRWLAARGTTGSRDTAEALRQVQAFIEAHGSSRFFDMDNTKLENLRVVNRAGFRKQDDFGDTEYWILSEVFAKEVCAGYDPRTVASELRDLGYLIPEGNHLRSKRTAPEMGRIRVYVIKASVLEAE